MKNLILLTFALLLCASIYGQRNNNAEYWNTWEYKAKEDMNQEFQAAAAKKTAMFNNTDSTAIITYRITTGANSGTYVRVEAGKSPADYDLDRSAEGKYWRDSVSQYIAENYGQVRWQRLNDGSYNYDPATSEPAKIVQRTTYNVRANKIMHFRRFMTRLAKVAEKRGWQAPRLLFRLQSGGNRNQFVLAVTYDTYKRPPRVGEAPTATTEEDYNELFGWGSWREDIENFDASLEYWGEYTETLELVPNMSSGMIE